MYSYRDHRMKILLTGSSGTIGTRLFETLLQQGHDVTGIDRRSNVWRPDLNSRTLQINLLDSDALEAAPSAELLIHFAANARVYDLVKTPSMALENAITTFHVLEFARKQKIKKILFSSSRETYGNIMKGKAIREEEASIQNCESPYAASKFTNEAYLHSYAACYGMQSIIIRFSNVYGMYDNFNCVIPLWISQLRGNKDIVVYGKEKTLDFTYIDDCVDGVIGAIQRFSQAAGQTFNLGYGNDVSLVYVAKKLSMLFNARSRINVSENRTGEAWKFRANISKAKKYLGYTPRIGIDEGLIKTVAWYEITMPQ